MTIVFTRHAREKFAVLRRHGVHVTEKMVVRAVEQPEYIDRSHAPLRIAQAPLDAAQILNGVYRSDGRRRTIITFYPGRISQYAPYGNRNAA